MKQHVHISSKQRGMTLIDLLVAVVLFTIGVLGLVGMQATMMKTQLSSEDRATAAALADELVADCQMSYATTVLQSEPACSMSTAWTNKVSALLPSVPVNTPTLTSNASGVWTITISWNEPSRGVDTYFTEFTLP